MNASQLANEVRDVAERCAALIAARQRTEAEAVRQTALRCEPLIQKLWKNTIQGLEDYLACGSPPSILRLIGVNNLGRRLSDLENPFNRILKWCAKEREEHGFGREFLKKLSAHLKFHTMTRDLETCSSNEVEVYGEKDRLDNSGNEPDLVVCTPRAMLMLENKVGSGQTGDNYVKYPSWFRDYARRCGKEALCLLSTRYQNECPQDWVWLKHKHLAQVFRNVASASRVPIWGRIVAVQCAVTLENAEDDDIAELIRATKHEGRITIPDWKTVLSFQPRSNLDEPWKHYDGQHDLERTCSSL